MIIWWDLIFLCVIHYRLESGMNNLALKGGRLPTPEALHHLTSKIGFHHKALTDFLSNMDFGPVTEGHTEINEYEPTVHNSSP